MTVAFDDAFEADSCVAALNKRLWGSGRVLIAAAWDGREKFKSEETDAERDARLRNWEQFLAGIQCAVEIYEYEYIIDHCIALHYSPLE